MVLVDKRPFPELLYLRSKSFVGSEKIVYISIVPFFGVLYELCAYKANKFLLVHFKTVTNTLGCNLVSIFVESHWSLTA